MKSTIFSTMQILTQLENLRQNYSVLNKLPSRAREISNAVFSKISTFSIKDHGENLQITSSERVNFECE